jgi:amidase/6-aminohexanoate-cyclic-dimer hydrolase
MTIKEYGSYDGLGLADLVRTRQVSARELLDEAVARTEKIDPQINAVVVKHYDYARAQIDRGLPDGPFAGVPFLLKDLELLEGTRTTWGASIYKDRIADHYRHPRPALPQCRRDRLRQEFEPGIRIDADHRVAAVRPDPKSMETDAFVRRLFRRCRRRGRRAHSSRCACQRWWRLDPHSSLGVGRIRIKTEPRAQSARPDRGEGWSGFSCGHVVSISVRDSAAMLDAIQGPEASSPYVAPPPERPFAQEVGRNPGRLRIAFTDKSPYGDAIDPEIAAVVRDIARMLAGLGHHVEERAPSLPADPAAVMSAIVAANTGLTVRMAERRFGRAMTDSDFEILTLASAHNAQKQTAVDYVSAQQDAFQILRSLATFFESCDVFLSPTLCTPPLRIGELDTMSDDLSHVAPILRRYMPGTSMFNISGQPAMSVPLAWNAAGLPLGMMFAAPLGGEATLLRLAAQLERERPWKDKRPPVCA